jgi:hypothetical protein
MALFFCYRTSTGTNLRLPANSPWCQKASFVVLAACVGFLIRIQTSDFPRLIDWT